ncbi:MAG: hypothetical protein FWC61_02315, partial [Proteobacteria bacterium]|nr:hypothetical protein [Pseudomonadota bacterium]
PSAVAASGAEPLPPTGAPARLVVSRGVDMRGENLDHPNFEIDSVPYKLFSITTGDKPLSAGIWAQMARAEYDAAIASGRAPIFVGGAGFYLRALTDGMSPMPAVPTAARAAAREFAGVDLAGAYEYLKTIDAPWAAAINKNDTQRIVRGIEVFRSTGRPLSEWQNAPRIPMLPAPPLKILIMPDRGLLRERISARMPDLAQSVLTEVGDILESGFDKSLPIWKADGILEISRYLRGEIDFDAAVDLWRAKICNHNMKHQYTWFKTNFAPDIVIDHIPTEKDLDLILQGPRRT